MDQSEQSFEPFRRKMQAEGLPELAIEAFRRHHQHWVEQRPTEIREADIESTPALPTLDEQAEAEAAGRSALAQTVVIKLNGGLATSMGMRQAKSLLTVKEGLSFLDVIARQVQHLRADFDCELPLLLMDSFRTQADSLAALAPYDLAVEGLALDFVQHKVPRIALDGGVPIEWAAEPAHEWCPPGHGDIYCALVTSGALAALRSRGIRYAFVSNADNLGATLDLRILGSFAESGAPFLMEVTERTLADRKGGHLARRRSDGRLVLRESAQCHPDEVDAFQDTERHGYFNTNNLWFDLDALQATLDASGGVIDLPVMVNEKSVDPGDSSSPAVVQLETAMGAAIEAFEGSQALCVPRSRFAPVKTTDDLLLVMSDAYELSADQRIVRADSGPAPLVKLDSKFYKRIDDFQQRFPKGAPSLRGCSSLTVTGDVHFGAGVVVEGEVEVSAPAAAALEIEDATTLKG